MDDSIKFPIKYIFSQSPRSVFIFFLRFLYPGIIICAYIYWRYGRILDLWNIPSPIDIVIIALAVYIFGTILYYTYRSLFHPIVRLLEIHFNIMPQYKLFIQLAIELKLPKEIINYRIMLGCISEVQNKMLNANEKEELWFNNSSGHAIFMTALASLGALAHDFVTIGLNNKWIGIWLSIFLFFTIIGFLNKSNANERETQMLLRYRKECKKYLRERASLEIQ